VEAVMKSGRILISEKLLAEILLLHGIEIVDARFHRDREQIELLVAGNGLSDECEGFNPVWCDLESGVEPPIVKPTYRKMEGVERVPWPASIPPTQELLEDCIIKGCYAEERLKQELDLA